MRKFSWTNFGKFIITLIAGFLWIWLLWGIVDIDLHNIEPNDKPSDYNPYVIFCNIVESEVK